MQGGVGISAATERCLSTDQESNILRSQLVLQYKLCLRRHETYRLVIRCGFQLYMVSMLSVWDGGKVGATETFCELVAISVRFIIRRALTHSEHHSLRPL